MAGAPPSRKGVQVTDPFCTVLAAANLAVAVMNFAAWRATHDGRDVVGALAWLGSAAYWVLRGVIPI